MAAPVQIVWSFDTTGSMSSCLESVKSQIQDLSQRLLSDIPTLEIGLIAHGDYCDRHTSYLIKKMPFSSDPEAIKKWVSQVGSTGGGDAPEAYEIALRAAAKDFDWKENARKVLALIGDEVPHEASFPNGEGVDWNTELSRLADQGVRCFGVQCLSNRHAEHFYRALAERTDGLWLPMQDLRIMKDVFVAVCLQVADTKAFDQFYSQLAQSGPVATALVPLMTRLAKKKKLTNEELAALCGIVGKLASQHGQPPKEVFLPIDMVEVSVTAEHEVCEVELVQTFTNKDELAGKANTFEYRFALPTSAAVFHFEAHLSSGRIIKGIVKAKEEARREYNRAISRGEKAFLMEEKNADIFSMELGNLEKGETVKIVLKYVTEAEEIGNAWRLRLPQHVAPRSGGRAVNGLLSCYPLSVLVRSLPSSGIRAIRSLSHSDRFELQTDASDANVSGLLKLMPEDGLLSNDLVFDMDMDAIDGAQSLAVGKVSVRHAYHEQSRSNIVQVVVRPPAATAPFLGMHLALVLDRSCSMQGPVARLAKDAASQVLNDLSVTCPGVNCSCMLMNHNMETICSANSALEAKAVLTEWQGKSCGGTDFDAALDAVQSMSRKAQVVLFVSDGKGPENLQRLFMKISKREGDARIFCLGVGPDPGMELLEGLADITGGICEVASMQSEVESVAHRLVAALASEPVELEVELVQSGHLKSAKWEQWPEKVLAYPGRRAVVYARKCEEGAELLSEVKVNGESIPVHCHEIESLNLHRLAARKRIAQLERSNVDGTSDGMICKLALEHGLASSQTSFVAIDEKAKIEGSNSDNNPSPPEETRAAAAGHEVDMLSECSMESLMERRSLDTECIRMERPSAARGSVESVRMAAAMSCESMLNRSVDLEVLSAKSAAMTCDVKLFKCKSKKRSMASTASRAAGSISDVATNAGAWFANLRSSFTRPKATNTSEIDHLVGPTPDVPMKEVALQGHATYFKGTIQHKAFGVEEVVLKLTLDKFEEGQYLGRWTAMGQAEAVVLILDEATGTVTIKDVEKNETVLQGKMDVETCSISGEVTQAGVGGGRFHLKPEALSRVEVIDTDGDHLVFVRLLGGGVAEYCNGKLVVASIKSMRIQKHSGYCHDGEGEFTVPSKEIAKLAELEALLRQESIPVTA